MGGIFLLVEAIGGMILAINADANFATGNYMIEYPKFLMRGGHSYAMPFALFNLIFGLVLPRLYFTIKMKNVAAVVAACALLLPIGLVLRGITYPSMTFAIFGFSGAFCFIASSIFLIYGGIKKMN